MEEEAIGAICGIDPGKSGGIAFIAPSTGALAWLLPMPSMVDLARILDDTHPSLVILEKAQSMPKQGIASAFNYGEQFGIIQGFLIALQIPHQLVTPRDWQKEMFKGCKTSDPPKKRALMAVQRIYPQANLLATERSRMPHDGIIDALLIAKWGWLKYESREGARGA